MLLSPVIDVNLTPSRQLLDMQLHCQEHGCILRGGIIKCADLKQDLLLCEGKDSTGQVSFIVLTSVRFPPYNFRSTDLKSALNNYTWNLQ